MMDLRDRHLIAKPPENAFKGRIDAFKGSIRIMIRDMIGVIGTSIWTANRIRLSGLPHENLAAFGVTNGWRLETIGDWLDVKSGFHDSR